MTLTNSPTANRRTITGQQTVKTTNTAPTTTTPSTTPAPSATPATTNAPRNFLKELYEAQAKSQKETLKQNYDKNIAKMTETQEENRLRTDANLNRTNVESRKAARNYGEIQNAYGLTSGAMGQAKLAQDNQLQKDLTLLRLNQDRADANINRDKALLNQLYLSDQAKVDAQRDMQIAKDLYAQQIEAGKLLASKGDYTKLGEAYGLTEEEIAKLMPEVPSGYTGGGGWSWNQWIDHYRNSGGGDRPTGGGGGVGGATGIRNTNMSVM